MQQEAEEEKARIRRGMEKTLEVMEQEVRKEEGIGLGGEGGGRRGREWIRRRRKKSGDKKVEWRK